MTPLTKTPILLAALFFTACVGGRLQAYTKADQPLFDVLRELEKNPGNTEAQKNLPALYQAAVMRHKAVIMSLCTGKHYDRFNGMDYEWEILKHINDAIRSVPVAFAIIKPVDDWGVLAAFYYDRQEIDRYSWDMLHSSQSDCNNNQR